MTSRYGLPSGCCSLVPYPRLSLRIALRIGEAGCRPCLRCSSWVSLSISVPPHPHHLLPRCLQAGISPGTVLVFLLAGPATNIATLGLVRRELGTFVLVAYLSMVCVSAIALGLLTDLLVSGFGIDIHAQTSQSREVIPEWLATISLIVLLVFAIRPVRAFLLHR